MLRSLTAGRAALVAAPIIALAAPSFADEVTIQTNFGIVSLEVEPDGHVYGDYPNYQGELSGSLSPDGVLDMIWIQPSSEKRCATTQFGSRFWGRVRWDVDGDSVAGVWNYCDDPYRADYVWNGTIVEGVAAFGQNAPQSVTDQQVAEAVRYEWGQYAARQGDHSVASFDINCDGAPDKIVSRVDKDSPDGPFFTVMALASWKGEVLSDSLYFQMGGDSELSVCSAPDMPAPMIEPSARFEPSEVLNMTGYDGLCGQAIRVDDGMCDSHFLFWSNEMITDGHFVGFRN